MSPTSYQAAPPRVSPSCRLRSEGGGGSSHKAGTMSNGGTSQECRLASFRGLWPVNAGFFPRLWIESSREQSERKQRPGGSLPPHRRRVHQARGRQGEEVLD